MVQPAPLSLLLLFFCASCADAPGAATPACTPDRALWDREVRAQVAAACGDCHGATVRYGAPYALTDYPSLLRGAAGQRPVDRMAARLVAGTMPPASTPAPSEEVARAIASWARCGAASVPEGRRLRASAPRFRSEAQTPAGLTAWTLRAGGHALPHDRPDHYQCFAFDAPVTEDRFVRRFEMAYDRTEVLHHLVVFRDGARSSPLGAFDCDGMPEGSHYLYAWAPGEDAFQFPDGGIRLRPGERYVMQIHYNNSALAQGIRDDSGVRVLHGPTEGAEYGMVALGPVSFSLPPRAQTAVASRCTVPRETRVLAAMPHMHRLGDAFSQSLVDAQGVATPFFSLQGWAFETQIFYAIPAVLPAGARLETRCTFQNNGSEAVSAGSRTANEMCFQFMYASPPWGAAYCDEGLDDAPAYTPGACLDGAAPPASLSRVVGGLAVRTVDAVGGPTLPSRRWALEGTEVLLRSERTPVGAVDLTRSSTASRVWAVTEPGRLRVDGAVHIDFRLTAGSSLSRDQAVSMDLRTETPSATGPYTAACAEPMNISQRVAWAVNETTLTLTAQLGGAMAPLGAWVVLRFRTL
jgi:hypothetical protein